MKIILLQHVKGIGKKGEITEVSDGYAQNALIPKGLAKVATAAEVNKLQLSQSAKIQKISKEKQALSNTLGLLNGKSITVYESVNEKGVLYHSFGIKDIAAAIKSQLKTEVPEELFTEKYAFKEQGEYTLDLQYEKEQAQLHLSIQAKK